MSARVKGLLGLWLMVAMLGMTGVLTAPPASAADSAADRYVACLNGSHRGDLMVLVDTSASLRDSDAANARVRAGEFLLRRLARSAEDGKLELNVQLAGFANRYEPGHGWDQLNPGSVNKVLGDVREYSNRNTGQGTDYWLGLDGARKELTERKNAQPNSCQAVVFFSDGSLDIDRASDEDDNPVNRPYAPDNKLRNDADRAAAVRAASEDLCRPGGLADQLRTPPITIFGVGLTAGGSKASDFDLMKRVVVGGGGCGKLPPSGEFALASDIDSLLQAFDKVAGQATQREGGYCQGSQAQACDEGAHDFVLDSSIGSVGILGSGEVVDPRVVLLSPAGKQVELKKAPFGQPQKADSDGVGIDYTWLSDKSFTADLRSGGSPAWTGRWRMVFFDPKGGNPQAKSRTSIHISGNVFPTWPKAEQSTVRAGESQEVTFGVQDADRKPVDPAKLLGSATLDAVLVDGSGKEVPIATGLSKEQLATPQKLDATGLKPGPASIRLSLKVTTASWRDPRSNQTAPGTELTPQLSEIGFTVAPPAGFGQVDPRVNFGSVEGPVRLSAPLRITGPGCVWLDRTTPPVVTTGPKEINQVTVESPASDQQSCVKVAEGATGELPLTLSSEQVGQGSLTGTLPIKMAALNAPEKVQDLSVDYGAEVSRPLNKVNFALVLLAALILGPGIPLLLLYLVKWATAKILPGQGLLVQQIPVQVAGGELLRDGQPLALREGDLRDMARIDSRGSRRVDLGGIVLQARAGRSPFGPGYVVVDSGSQVGASSELAEPSGKKNQARLPLSVQQTWFLLHDPNGSPDQALAVLLVGGHTTQSQRADLVEDLRRRGREVMDNLRAVRSTSDTPPPGAGDPFGGGQQGPGGPGGNPFGEGAPFGGGAPQPFGGQPSGGPAAGGPSSGGPAAGGPPPGGPRSGGAPDGGRPHGGGSSGGSPTGGVPGGEGQGGWGAPGQQGPSNPPQDGPHNPFA